MDKDCCKVRGSLCGMRGSHHQFDCTCTGCRPNTGIIAERLSPLSFGAVIEWGNRLPRQDMKEFARMLGAPTRR